MKLQTPTHMQCEILDFIHVKRAIYGKRLFVGPPVLGTHYTTHFLFVCSHVLLTSPSSALEVFNNIAIYKISHSHSRTVRAHGDGLACCVADGKPSKCVLEVEKIKRRRQQRRAAHVAAREQQPDPGCISDSSQLGYGYDVMIASVVGPLLTLTIFSSCF